jgi:uncharacterized protein involved in exopolysaccharide biosynthesis
MEKITTNCPVCENGPLSEELDFCPTCRWENIRIPTDASPALTRYFQERISIHHELYQIRTRMEAENQELRTANRQLEERLKDLETEGTPNKKSAKTQEELEKKIRVITKEKDDLSVQLKICRTKLAGLKM